MKTGWCPVPRDGTSNRESKWKKYYDYDSRHTVYQDRQSDCMEGIVDKCVYCLIEKFAKKPHKVVNEHLFFKIDINILNQYQTNINTDG